MRTALMSKKRSKMAGIRDMTFGVEVQFCKSFVTFDRLSLFLLTLANFRIFYYFFVIDHHLENLETHFGVVRVT